MSRDKKILGILCRGHDKKVRLVRIHNTAEAAGCTQICHSAELETSMEQYFSLSMCFFGPRSENCCNSRGIEDNIKMANAFFLPLAMFLKLHKWSR